LLAYPCDLRNCYAFISSASLDNPAVFHEAAALVFGGTPEMPRSRNLSRKASNALLKMIPEQPEFPVCPLCNRHVVLETAKVDEYGKAMHEECYLLKLHLKQDKPA